MSVSIEVDTRSTGKHLEWWWLSISPETRVRVINASAEIATVLQYTDDYDDEFLRPTDHAFSRASHLIGLAYVDIQQQLPLPRTVADGRGGLRLRWLLNNKEVMLACDAEVKGDDYIYHQQDDTYDIERGINAEKLASWLRWLIRNDNQQCR